MDSGFEHSSLGLSGLKLSPVERPHYFHRPSRKRSADPDDEGTSGSIHVFTNHVIKGGKKMFSSHLAPHSNVNTTSPLVLQIYNRKKAMESAAKRIKKQNDHVRRRRLLSKKTNVLEPTPEKYILLKKISPTTNSSKLLPRLVHTKTSCILNGASSHANNEINTAETFNKPTLCPLHRLQHQRQLQRYESNEQKTVNQDSSPMRSATSSGNNSPRIHNYWHAPTHIRCPPSYDSYNGFFHKNNRIILTKKLTPSPYWCSCHDFPPKACTPIGRHRTPSSYQWSDVDQGAVLDREISSLSITGNVILK